MNIKPTAWMKELPTGEGVERAVRTTTVKEVADDWENPIPLFTADDLRAAVLAEREACLALVNQGTGEATSSDALKILRMERDRISAAIRARSEP